MATQPPSGDRGNGGEPTISIEQRGRIAAASGIATVLLFAAGVGRVVRPRTP
jgi:hypothetical protein